jgi:hypothetical protein
MFRIPSFSLRPKTNIPHHPRTRQSFAYPSQIPPSPEGLKKSVWCLLRFFGTTLFPKHQIPFLNGGIYSDQVSRSGKKIVTCCGKSSFFVTHYGILVLQQLPRFHGNNMVFKGL